MLVDESGLKVAALEPPLAAMLGAKPGQEGSTLIAVADRFGRRQIQHRDFVYCLCGAPGSLARRLLIDPKGKDPNKFIELIEKGIKPTPESHGGDSIARVTSATVAPAAVQALSAAERLAGEAGKAQVGEAALTLALLETAPDDLRRLLVLWAGEEEFKRVLGRLRIEIDPAPARAVDLFRDAAYEPSGRRFTGRLLDDAASLGATKITTRHVLYTLLSNDGCALSLALAARGFSVKKELHSVLVRELGRPGRKRNDALRFRREDVFDGVEKLLADAHKSAIDRGRTRVSEYDVCRALAAKWGAEVQRLSPGHEAMDLSAIRAYIETAEPEEERDESHNRLKTSEIEAALRKRILGQEGAIAQVIPWVKRLRFGLPREGRPAGVFLFLGPTGAGKTQMAKELARYVFGDPDMMIFMEMGQFQSKEAMNMFIGAPPGYVGYGDGKLTNGLRDKPRSVVLFDEIEKAESQVFDALLRFSDEGMISDPAGPVRDGRNCIIVMTTNAGQTWLREHLAANPDARNDPELRRMLYVAAMEELKEEGFRTEFLGRVDERIVFLPFTQETCRDIVRQVLDGEIKRLREVKGITLEVNDEACAVLGRLAYERSIEEGARAAPRAINQLIITRLIDRISSAEEAAAEGGAPPPSHMIVAADGEDNVVLEVIA